MPQQLIYTSAPRGVVAGRSGHCTVARSSAMREALMLQLEKMSYYQHLSLSGGQERPISSCRVLDIRGSRYHVLTRIQDAGLDFTGRTNFLAHHLVFAPEEVRRLASPPVILRAWAGWVRSWSKEPQMLESEAWSGLAELSSSAILPATNWQQVTGDAVNGYSVLDSRVGTAFRVDNLPEDRILALFAESLELLELRDPRRDFRTTAWQYTFTTSMQEQDNPADFRWRCLHSDNPASSRFAGPDCRPLSDLRAQRVTAEETTLARSGRQSPRFVLQPQNVRATEGETARLQARAEGVPSPSYQWFTVDRAGNGQAVANGTNAELAVQNPPLGVTRYVVRANNSQGEATSEVATLSVDPKPRLAQASTDREAPGLSSRPAAYVKSADQIERQRRQLEAKQTEAAFQQKLRRRKILMICAVVFGLAALGTTVCLNWPRRAPNAGIAGTNLPTAAPLTETQAVAQATDSTGATNTVPILPKATDAASDQAPATEHDIIKRGANDPKLPVGWSPLLIGTVSNPYAEFHSPRYELSANAPGFAEQGDSIWFVYRTDAGNTFEAKIVAKTLSVTASACGIMMRQSPSSTAAFLFVGANESGVIAYGRDGLSKFHQSQVRIAEEARAKAILLRIEKKGERRVASYAIESHKSWQPVNLTNEWFCSEPVLSGLAVCSGSLSNRVGAKFESVSPQ